MESMKKRGALDLSNVAARALKLEAMGRINAEAAHEIKSCCKRALRVIAEMEEWDGKGELIDGQAS
jgi:hypothetical protein